MEIGLFRIKKVLSFFVLLALCTNVKGGNFVAYSTANVYDIPGDTSYLEVDFKVPATSLKFMLEDLQGYDAKLKIYIGIYQNNNAVYADKYIITSPKIDSKLDLNFNILDAKRIKLPPGTYALELFFQDANDTSQHAFIRKEIIVPPVNNDIHFSDIEMLDSAYPAKEKGVFTRFNYNLLPAIVNFIPVYNNTLFFYTEIYNSQPYAKNGLVQVHYSIVASNNADINRETDSFVHTYSHIKTKAAAKAIYLFDGIDIKNLPSGEYFLQLQIFNDSQRVIASRVMPFIRRGKKSGALDAFSALHLAAHSFIDSLGYKNIANYYPYLYSVETMDENDEFARLKSKGDTLGIKAWFYKFWQVRAPQNPYQAYKDYDRLLAYSQEKYKSPISPGYKTDMGRVCLRYGIPDHIASAEEKPAAYAYQIWRYSYTKGQVNIHFVFYNPTSSPNDFVLLHSDATGEIANPGWKTLIYRRTSANDDLDHETMPKGLGKELDQKMAE